MRLFLGVTLIAALIATSCAPRAAVERSASYKRDLDRLEAEARARLVLPQCKGDTAGFKTCGLLVFEFRDEGCRRRFTDTECSGIAYDECLSKYRRLFMHAVVERYDRAVVREVESRCASSTEMDCHRWYDLELAWLDSHNSHVEAEFRQALHERERQQEDDQDAVAEHARRMRAIGDALQESGRRSQESAAQTDTSYHPAPVTTGQ